METIMTLKRGKNHWPIQNNPSLIELTLWEGREVRVFNVRLGDFAAGHRKGLAPATPYDYAADRLF
jgi:hypothetical protein